MELVVLARLVVRIFKDIWHLKKLCLTKEKGITFKIYHFIYNWYQYEHGSAISYKCVFNSTPILPRGNKQIIIDENSIIGSGCVIFQQVTIQSKYNEFGSPKIGDNCCIYPGAKIIGDITIGDNVIIEANSVVTFDVEDNTTVMVAKPNILWKTHNE